MTVGNRRRQGAWRTGRVVEGRRFKEVWVLKTLLAGQALLGIVLKKICYTFHQLNGD